MSIKSIATVVTDLAHDGPVLEAAITLTRQMGGHLDVLCLGVDRTQPGFYYATANAIVTAEFLTQAQADAEALETEVEARLRREDIAYSVRRSVAQIGAMTPLVAHRLRFADLVVLGKPYGEGITLDKEMILEAALFNADVPVLVMPKGAALPGADTHAIIAWNESREALVAVRRSLPFLAGVSTASVAVIDPPAHGPDRSDPGGELSEMLARHGVRPEVSVLARTMPRISDILCRHVKDKEAGLVVMGAYGHSRFREAILGGATRNMLEMTEVPLFLAH